MADFGLVLFKEDKTAEEHEKVVCKNSARKLFKRFVGMLFEAGFFKTYIGAKLYYIFRQDDFKDSLRSVELFDNVKAWLIELPFPLRRFFQFNESFLMGYIEKTCAEKGIQFSLLPERLRGGVRPNSLYEHTFIAKLILKSLLVQVLESIYNKADLRIENLDIVVIPGNEEEELFSIIKMLEPNMKFVTVLSALQNKEHYEARLSDLFSDTGLSFNVSSDYKNTLKNAGLIINLGNTSEICRFRLHRKSLVINLYDADSSRLQGENAVINGIAFEFPDKSFKDFLYDLRGLYNKKEICEIVFIHKLEFHENSKHSYELFCRIQKEFQKGCCRISGFEGHRGIISLENVARSIIM